MARDAQHEALVMENKVLQLVIHSGFVGGLPPDQSVASLERAIDATQAHVDVLKRMHKRADVGDAADYEVQVQYFGGGKVQHSEVYPMEHFTIKKLKLSILESLCLIRGNKSRPDKNFTYHLRIEYPDGNAIEEPLLDNRQRVGRLDGIRSPFRKHVVVRSRHLPVDAVPSDVEEEEHNGEVSDASGMPSDDDDDSWLLDLFPADFLQDGSDFNDAHAVAADTGDDTITVLVHAPSQGRPLFTLMNVPAGITAFDLKIMIVKEVHRRGGNSMSLGVDDFRLAANQFFFKDADLISRDVIDGVIHVEFSFLIRGGAPSGVRKHTTKEEATKRLKSRVVSNACGRETFDDIAIPDDLKEFATKVEDQIAQIQMLQSQGHHVVKLGLKQCSTENLKKIHDLCSYSGSGRRGNNDERASAAVYHLFPTMTMVQGAVASLEGFEKKCMASLLTILVNEYSEYQNIGVATLKLDKFKGHVEDEQNERRRQSSPAVIAEGQSGGCITM